jgi:putative flippase GtrA
MVKRMEITGNRKRDTAPRPSGFAVVGRQAAWFTAIGGVLTLAYFVLYLELRNVLSPQPANYLAWALTAVADTAANRQLTFGASGRIGHARAQVEGLLIFALGLALTSTSLAGLVAGVRQPRRLLELAVLAGANLTAGLLRFELLRRWVFAEHRYSRAHTAP